MIILIFTVASPAIAQVEVLGDWGPVNEAWLVNAEHAVHMPTGKILVWESGNVRLWNPTNPTKFPILPNNFIFDCAGHAPLPDGSVLIVNGGGDCSPIANVAVFGLDEKFKPVIGFPFPARFYPTCTTLPDGTILISGGWWECNPIPHLVIYDPYGVPSVWQTINPTIPPQPGPVLRTYPWMFVQPDGKIFFAGGGNDLGTWELDLTGPSWTFVDDSTVVGSIKGAAVIYQKGDGSVEVLKNGGQSIVGGVILDDTEIIDLTDPAPAWLRLPEWQMLNQRQLHNLVLLPDGHIFAVGGENDGGFAVMDAEWFDPEQPDDGWAPLATMLRQRGRHSTAVLLLDGTVLAVGDDRSSEIFSPPYLFAPGGRPVIVSAPGVITYNREFYVGMANGSMGIGKVTLVRLAAVTHWFDHNQRLLSLEFVVAQTEEGDVTLAVTAPVDSNLAPPGQYMLFAVSLVEGVPSIGRYVTLR